MIWKISKANEFHHSYEEEFAYGGGMWYAGKQGGEEMDLTKYQVFLKTVECGSFTAAAQQLSFTQSGVSHAISGLEEELGVTLLSRSRGA